MRRGETRTLYKEFQNPILPGFHPDPSICRVENDYYLATSTFHFGPGVPIFHSRDLVHWRQIGHALDRSSQLYLDDARPSGGIYAPTLRFFRGQYYLITTNVTGGGNFLVTATDPSGPWSDPIWFSDTDGIDPSLFFDDDGRCYMTGNGNPEVSLYEGHHTIWLQELDLARMALIGEPVVIVDGGVDISKEPIWIEGPHLYKVDGRYYLLAAEGGTGTDHSVVIFRSEAVLGPYAPFDGNPILTNRSLDPNRPNPITCTGHGDLVETQNGEWWMVLLGCRPYPPYLENCYNTGRETFLVPMTWVDGWPVTRDGSASLRHSYPCPDLVSEPWLPPVRSSRSPDPEEFQFSDVLAVAPPGELPSINCSESCDPFDFHDDFDGERLADQWNFVRRTELLAADLSVRTGYLRLATGDAWVTGPGQPSFVGVRQRHLTFSASTSIEFQPRDENDVAGLCVMQNSVSAYVVSVALSGGVRVVRLERCFRDTAEVLVEEACGAGAVRLRIEGNAGECRFAFGGHSVQSVPLLADGCGCWHALGSPQDARILSTEKAGGFVGAYIGLFASRRGSEGRDTTRQHNHADFEWFDYRGK